MGEVAESTVRPPFIDPEAPGQRKVAIVALLVVTSVWGATFIWMKQALNALQPEIETYGSCLLYTSPSPRDATLSRMPSSA